MRSPDQIVAAARACVGVPFRPQGRDPVFGLDCVGLAAHAFGAAAPASVPQRGGSVGEVAALITAAGLRPLPPEQARPGGLLLLAPGPRQFHLAVLTDCGFVHADAGLRRVVEAPGPPRWPVRGAWATEVAPDPSLPRWR